MLCPHRCTVKLCNRRMNMEELTEQKCVACRVGAPSVTTEEIKELQPQVPEWKIITEDEIPKLQRCHFIHPRGRRGGGRRRTPSPFDHRVGQGRRYVVDAQDQKHA